MVLNLVQTAHGLLCSSCLQYQANRTHKRQPSKESGRTRGMWATLKHWLQGKQLLRSFWDITGVYHKEPSPWQCAIDDRLPTLAQVPDGGAAAVGSAGPQRSTACLPVS
jgi:hypothetical protein